MDDEGTNSKKTPADKAAASTPPAAPHIKLITVDNNSAYTG